MIRRILAVPAGLIAGIICITIVEKIGHQLYPPPAGAGSDDMVAMKNYVAQAPFMALFFVIIAYAIAAFISGVTASKVANNGKHTSAVVCGVIFLCITIYSGFGFWGLLYGDWYSQEVNWL